MEDGGVALLPPTIVKQFNRFVGQEIDRHDAQGQAELSDGRTLEMKGLATDGGQWQDNRDASGHNRQPQDRGRGPDGAPEGSLGADGI